ncbi:hypothetical protein [Winogradskyella sp.]|uniref:hypothetical protein n=1 Tax=Winogradskyella sp. TaxID=1883156 RepID=UPI0026126A45|nr:hypothetical protein [Winogradskyella sp.]
MKNLLNLGKALNRAEQKQVFGGDGPNRLRREDGICSDYYYAEPCPTHGVGGCWVIEYWSC